VTENPKKPTPQSIVSTTETKKKTADAQYRNTTEQQTNSSKPAAILLGGSQTRPGGSTRTLSRMLGTGENPTAIPYPSPKLDYKDVKWLHGRLLPDVICNKERELERIAEVVRRGWTQHVLHLTPEASEIDEATKKLFEFKKNRTLWWQPIAERLLEELKVERTEAIARSEQEQIEKATKLERAKLLKKEREIQKEMAEKDFSANEVNMVSKSNFLNVELSLTCNCQNAALAVLLEKEKENSKAKRY